jgi:hypothetical protein
MSFEYRVLPSIDRDTVAIATVVDGEIVAISYASSDESAAERVPSGHRLIMEDGYPTGVRGSLARWWNS